MRLRDSPAPRYLSLDAPVRVDAPETTLLGELAGSHTEAGETTLTITIRHVLTQLSELTRMRRALMQEAGPRVDMGSAARTAKTGRHVNRD